MDPRKPGFGALLLAEQEILTKQAVRAQAPLNPSENDPDYDDEAQFDALVERNAERSAGEDYD